MEQSLTHIMHQTVGLMDAAAESLLKKQFGISYARFHFLVMLSKSPCTTQHGLSAKLGHSDAAISRMAAALQKEQLLTITQDPAHARHNSLVLTKAGTTLVKDASSMLEGKFTELLQTTHIDLDTYHRITLEIRDALQKYNEGKVRE